jgi:ATP-dependent protease ClpP protease subunit
VRTRSTFGRSSRRKKFGKPMAKRTSAQKEKSHLEKKSILRRISKIDKSITQKIAELQQKRGNCLCFPLLMGNQSITGSIVDDTFQELRTNYKNCGGKLDVIVHSGGGDIDSAYNLAMTFQKFGTAELNFIVPRWAKSAATLLVCAGNQIMMTPIAELGPLDPQITELNPLEKRLEQYSPLHVEATLDLIRGEYRNDNVKFADKLTERLQFPMTLGGIKKTLDIARQYLVKLLESRMLLGDHEKSEEIAKKLTTGYADHGFCVNADEARTIGLKAVDLDGEQLDIVMEIHKLGRERIQLQKKLRQGKLSDMLDALPPELLEKLEPSMKNGEQ